MSILSTVLLPSTVEGLNECVHVQEDGTASSNFEQLCMTIIELIRNNVADFNNQFQA